MLRFIQLFSGLEQTQSTNGKLHLLRDYFRQEENENLAFAVHWLMGKKRKQLVAPKALKELLLQKTGLPFWVFQECYNEVGDLAETLHLLLPETESHSLADLKSDYVFLSNCADEARKLTYVGQKWHEYASESRFLFNKMISGSLRIGVSEGLVVKALAEAFDLSVHQATHALMGSWEPLVGDFKSLLEGKTQEDVSAPYPFCLAHTLENPIPGAEVSDWLVEKKWDGIRCQIVKRKGEVFIWSRGEELVNEQFPDLLTSFQNLPDGTVLDGEILAFSGSLQIEPFHQLQKRLNRKKPSAKIMTEIPCFVMAYDVLEHEAQDLRNRPLSERKVILKHVLSEVKIERLVFSKVYEPEIWAEIEKLRTESAEDASEGLMLKRKDSLYASGRKANVWLKWKSAPLTVDAVLMYAQKGHGKRSGLFTDYTFGLWKDGQLLPFAKAYSGLDNQEIAELNRWINQHTLDKFGPVRTVKPELVFEIAFEGINESKRHKSGFAVRFPRIARWRKDKKMEEAGSVEELRELMKQKEA